MVPSSFHLEPGFANDPAELFHFRVLDPSCGSAHFLVSALHRIAERIGRFLAETPLPGVRDELEALRAVAGTAHGLRIEHGELLHRLVLKRCVYGVDWPRRIRAPRRLPGSRTDDRFRAG